MKLSKPLVLTTLLAALIGAWITSAAAEDWSQFRGPNGTGVSATTGLPTEFGPGKNMIWKTALPPGHSSPVLMANRIFVTAYLKVEQPGKKKRACAGQSHCEGELQASRHRPGPTNRKNSLAARGAANNHRSLAERKQSCRTVTGNRWRECLRILPGVRSRLLHRCRQGALAPPPWAIQYVLRLWRLTDSCRRQSDPPGGSGLTQLLSNRGRQKQRTSALESGSAGRNLRLLNANCLSAQAGSETDRCS